MNSLVVGLLSYANGVHLNIPYSYSVLKGLAWFINILNNIRIPVTRLLMRTLTRAPDNFSSKRVITPNFFSRG